MRRENQSATIILLRVFSACVGAIGLVHLLTDLNWLQLHIALQTWLDAYLRVFKPIADFLFWPIYRLLQLIRIELPDGFKHYFMFCGIVGGALAASIVGSASPRLTLREQQVRRRQDRLRVGARTARRRGLLMLILARLVATVPMFFVSLFIAPFVAVLAVASNLGLRDFFWTQTLIVFDAITLSCALALTVVVANYILLQMAS